MKLTQTRESKTMSLYFEAESHSMYRHHNQCVHQLVPTVLQQHQQQQQSTSL